MENSFFLFFVKLLLFRIIHYIIWIIKKNKAVIGEQFNMKVLILILSVNVSKFGSRVESKVMGFLLYLANLVEPIF